MLENHLLSDLDDDLLLELDEVVRANQLNCLPFAKSNRAELLLHERHPSLAEDILEERQRRVRDIAFRAITKEDENRLSSSYRARVGSLDDLMSASPSQEKSRRKSKAARNAPFSPNLQPKDSNIDLMFDMDDDVPLAENSYGSPVLKPWLDLPTIQATESPTPRISWCEEEAKAIPRNDIPSSHSNPQALDMKGLVETPQAAKTWSSPAIPSSKLDLREIMAQTSSSRTSALSMSLSAQKAKDEAAIKQVATKLSQKERKKQQQQVLQQALSQTPKTVDKDDGKPSSPWQVASVGAKTSLKDVLDHAAGSPPVQPANSLAAPKTLTPRRTASPDTRFAGQARSSNAKSQLTSTGSRSTPKTEQATSSPLVPHSRSYHLPTGTAEPSLQLSMSDIIGQQRREQEVIKEAVAKRSLQEIQEEQAFQEWWNQESRRAQEEEAARAKSENSVAGRGGKGCSGMRTKNSGRGRGGRGRSDATRGCGRGRGACCRTCCCCFLRSF